MSKAVKRSIVVFIVIALCISGCSGKTAGGMISESSFQLDTVVTISLYGKYDENLIKAAFDEIDGYERILSRKLPGSDPYNMALHSGEGFVEVSADTLFLLNEGAKYSNLSGGLFDVTIGPLVSLWDINGGGYFPSDEERALAMSLINFEEVAIQGNSAMLNEKGMEVDFGAIAKGYIADKVKSFLIQNGVESGIINLGGNVALIGEKPGGENFKIGIRDPAGRSESSMGIVEISNKALVSSGSYERFFIHEGKTYHHILDPGTGFPVDNDLMQVTIIAEDALTGDALSTCAFLLGLEKGMGLINKTPGVSAVFVTNDKKVWLSSGFSEEFYITNDEYALEGEFMALNGPGAEVVVISGRDVIGTYRLGDDREIKIEEGDAINIISISNGKVEMLYANCPGGDCMRQRAIDKAGQTIVCLPNKVLVKIEGGGGKFDSVVY